MQLVFMRKAPFVSGVWRKLRLWVEFSVEIAVEKAVSRCDLAYEGNWSLQDKYLLLAWIRVAL